MIWPIPIIKAYRDRYFGYRGTGATGVTVGGPCRGGAVNTVNNRSCARELRYFEELRKLEELREWGIIILWETGE